MPIPTGNNLDTYLRQAITLGDAIMPLMPLLVEVESTEGWPEKGVFSVGKEIFGYDNTLAGDATHFWVTHRGLDGTLHEDHAVGDRVELRHISRHTQESNNLRVSGLISIDNTDRIVMRIPGHLRVVEVEVEVVTPAVGAAECQIVAVPVAAGSPVTPGSPLVSPLVSPFSPAVSPGEDPNLLGPSYYMDLNEAGRYSWDVDVPMGDPVAYLDAAVYIQWLHGSPAPVGGSIRVFIHTIAQELP